MLGNHYQSMNLNKTRDKVVETDPGKESVDDIQQLISKRGPCIDVYKVRDKIIIVIEVPGVLSAHTIDIKLSGHVLTVHGEIPFSYTIPEENILQNERFFGQFKREITLPPDISPTGEVEAEFKNGLIEIHIPRFYSKENEMTH